MKSKTIYVLRHGHSTFQEKVESGVFDDDTIDVGLSDLGHKQVSKLSGRLPLIFDLIVTSPLTRCIDTALGVMGKEESPELIINPLLRERLDDWCDIGRPASELRSKYPALDFSELEERWWYEGPRDDRGIPVESRELVSERAGELKKWIGERRENSILLVSHSGFLAELTGLSLPNCKPHAWD